MRGLSSYKRFSASLETKAARELLFGVGQDVFSRTRFLPRALVEVYEYRSAGGKLLWQFQVFF